MQTQQKGTANTIINEIQALISSPIFGFKDKLSVLQENIDKVSEIEIKAQIESFCASLNIDVSLLDLELPIFQSIQIDNKLNIPYFLSARFKMRRNIVWLEC